MRSAAEYQRQYRAQNPYQAERNRRDVAARKAADKRLRERHRAEYNGYLDDERRRLGLPAVSRMEL